MQFIEPNAYTEFFFNQSKTKTTLYGTTTYLFDQTCLFVMKNNEKSLKEQQIRII